jgi:hypothetical protein
MKQEVQIVLTLEVDTTETKEQIERFMSDVINTHTFHSSTHNRMVYSKLEITSIKEESEIYQLEN